jgi:hypothetical protein
MSKVDSIPIHYKGAKLGYATRLNEDTTRLVLKEKANEYYMLHRLIRKYDGKLVIDVDKPAEWVKEQVQKMAACPPKEKLTPHTEPESSQRLVLRGYTYPYRKELNELGLGYNGQEKLWYTYDPEKLKAARRLLKSQYYRR